MVSVKKKLDNESIFNILQEKPLMVQLIMKFFILTILIEIGIILLIIYQTKNITTDIMNDSSNFIQQKVNTEMLNITSQMKSLFQSELFNLGLISSQVMEGVVMVQESNYQSFFPYTFNLADFQGGVVLAPSTDFSTSSFFSPISSLNGATTLTTLIQAVPQMLAVVNLRRIVPFLVTDFIKSQIFRISVIYITTLKPEDSFMRVFPEQTLNPNLDLINGNGIYTQYLNIRTLTTDYINQPRIFINGPYSDDKSNCSTDCTTLMSVSQIISPSANTYFIVQVELVMDMLKNIFANHRYKSSVEFVVIYNTSSMKKIVYAPDYWNYLNGNPSADFSYSAVQQQSGIDFDIYQQLVVQGQQVIVQRPNKSGAAVNYLVNAVPFNIYLDIDGTLSYLDITVQNASNYYCVIIFGEQSQMYEITETIQTLTYKQEYTTIIICIISGFITVTLVTVVTYLVSSKLARPLRGLIKMAKRLNNNTMHKKSVMDQTKKEIEELLNQSQYQVKELIHSFKELINNIEKRNNKNKSSEKARSIEYPLNQYEQSFVEKAKGKSDIIWKTYNKFIENEPKFSRNTTKK